MDNQTGLQGLGLLPDSQSRPSCDRSWQWS